MKSLNRFKALISLVLVVCMALTSFGAVNVFAEDDISASGMIRFISGVSIASDCPVTLTDGANAFISGSYLQGNSYAISNDSESTAVITDAVILGVDGVAKTPENIVIGENSFVVSSEDISALLSGYTNAQKQLASDIFSSNSLIVLQKPSSLSASASFGNGSVTVTANSQTVNSGVLNYTFVPNTASCSLGEFGFSNIGGSYIASFPAEAQATYGVTVNYSVILNISGTEISALVNLPHSVCSKISNGYGSVTEELSSYILKLTSDIEELAVLYDRFVTIISREDVDAMVTLYDRNNSKKVRPIIGIIRTGMQTLGGSSISDSLTNEGAIIEVKSACENWESAVTSNGMSGMFSWADANYSDLKALCNDMLSTMHNVIDAFDTPPAPSIIPMILSKYPGTSEMMEEGIINFENTCAKTSAFISMLDGLITESSIGLVGDYGAQISSVASKSESVAPSSCRLSVPYTASTSITVSAPTVELTISAVGGGVVECDGSSFDYDVSSYEIGREMVLNAICTESSEFLLWKNSEGRVISANPQLRFVLSGKTGVQAVFAEKESSACYVMFLNGSNKVVGSGTYASGTVLGDIIEDLGISSEDAYFTDMYSFDCWDRGNDFRVTENTIINAVYTLAETRYNVTAIGGVVNAVTVDGFAPGASDNKYAYNSTVNVSVKQSEIPSGKHFAGWSVDDGASIVSYSENYRFCVSSDVEVVAVYASTSTNPVPAVSIMSVNSNIGKVTFVCERSLPDNYRLVSAGIILEKDSQSYNENTMILKNADGISLIKGTTVSTASNGKYTAIVNNADSVSARAYLVYIDDFDNLHEIYSNIITGVSAK